MDLSPIERAKAFIELCHRLINRLPLPETKDDPVVLSGKASSTKDFREAANQFLTQEQRSATIQVWMNFLHRISDEGQTRLGLRQALGAVAYMLGVEGPSLESAELGQVKAEGQDRVLSLDDAAIMLEADHAVRTMYDCFRAACKWRDQSDVLVSLVAMTSDSSERVLEEATETNDTKVRGSFAWGFGSAAALAAVFCGWWALNAPVTHQPVSGDRVPVETCILPSTPSNTHFISLDQPEPTKIVALDWEVTFSTTTPGPSSDGTIDISSVLSRSESVTFYVKGGFQDGAVACVLR